MFCLIIHAFVGLPQTKRELEIIFFPPIQICTRLECRCLHCARCILKLIFVASLSIPFSGAQAGELPDWKYPELIQLRCERAHKKVFMTIFVANAVGLNLIVREPQLETTRPWTITRIEKFFETHRVKHKSLETEAETMHSDAATMTNRNRLNAFLSCSKFKLILMSLERVFYALSFC